MEIDSDNNLSTTANELRCHAEARLRENAGGHPPRTRESAQRLYHELKVHEIELEMQNAELSQARDEVEIALEKFTNLYDFAPFGYFTLDRNAVVGSVNLGGATLLGTERSCLLGRCFIQFVTAESRMIFSGFMENVFARQGKQSCDVTLMNKLNSRLFVQIEAVVDTSRQECQFAVIDITARRVAEEENQKNRFFLDWVLEKACIGMWFGELSLGRIKCDAQTRKLFFVNPETDLDVDVYWSRVHPDDLDMTRQVFDNAISGQTLYEIDHRVVDPASGEIRWIHSVGQATYATDGTPLRYDGISYDISERKKSENLLQSSLEDLRFVNDELNRFNTASVGRELRMIELKKEINELSVLSGQSPRYPLDFEKE